MANQSVTPRVTLDIAFSHWRAGDMETLARWMMQRGGAEERL